jgi:hypothetical protein
MNPRKQHAAPNKSRKSFMKGGQVYIYKVYNPIKSYCENHQQLYPISPPKTVKKERNITTRQQNQEKKQKKRKKTRE